MNAKKKYMKGGFSRIAQSYSIHIAPSGAHTKKAMSAPTAIVVLGNHVPRTTEAAKAVRLRRTRNATK